MVVSKNYIENKHKEVYETSKKERSIAKKKDA